MSDQPPQNDREKREWIEAVRERLAQEEKEAKAKGSGAGVNGLDHDPPDADDERLRQLRLDIGLLNSESDPETITSVVDRIAECTSDEILRETLIKTIKKQTETSVAAMRAQIKQRAKEKPTPPPPSPRYDPDDWRNELILTAKKQLAALESNAMLAMRHHPDMVGVFGLDEFTQQACLLRQPPWGLKSSKFPRPAKDADFAELLAWVQRQGVHIRGRDAIRNVLAAVVQDKMFHPPREYLSGLRGKWDTKKRLSRWLTEYLGVSPIDNYTTPVGRMWMISAVARIFQPGCLAKYVLILEGPQDLGKSEVFDILGGEWYTADIAQLGTKDSQLQVGNAWIVELAELDSMKGAAIATTKAFISRKVDRFRPPYGEHIITQERQCVLAATVNPAGAYLHDETGAVRFWPVLATLINLAALRQDRDQLWAEAVHAYDSGEQWWPDGEFEGHEQQEQRSETAESDPWFDEIAKWSERRNNLIKAYEQDEIPTSTGPRKLSPDEYQKNLAEANKLRVFTAADALAGALEMQKDRMDRRAQLRLGAILRKLGYVSGGVRLTNDSDPVRRWHKKYP